LKNKILGLEGEKLAADFLLKYNYQILCQNWRHGHLEVDLIAKKDDILVFVEVKTRKNRYTGSPDITITQAKQDRIIRAAEHYIEKNNLDIELRFDVISIYLDKDLNHDIEWIQEAF
jgi:putative endonuclease